MKTIEEMEIYWNNIKTNYPESWIKFCEYMFNNIQHDLPKDNSITNLKLNHYVYELLSESKWIEVTGLLYDFFDSVGITLFTWYHHRWINNDYQWQGFRARKTERNQLVFNKNTRHEAEKELFKKAFEKYNLMITNENV